MKPSIYTSTWQMYGQNRQGKRGGDNDVTNLTAWLPSRTTEKSSQVELFGLVVREPREKAGVTAKFS